MHFNQPELMIENDHLDQNLFICLSVTLVIISTSRKRSLGQGNVLQEFVCPRERGRASASRGVCRGSAYKERGVLHPGGSASRGVGYTSLPRTRTAGGMHPTGMLFCLFYNGVVDTYWTRDRV